MPADVADQHSSGPAVTYDPGDPGFRDDPYPTYALLREYSPIHPGPLGIWLVSRYDDVAELLRSRSFSSDPNAWSIYPEVAEAIYGDVDCPVLALQRTWMMLRDGNSHATARRLVSRSLSGERVDQAVQVVRGVVTRLVANLRAQGGGDFIGEVAAVVPVKAVCHLLGMPYADGIHCQRLMDRVLLTFGLDRPTAESIASANEAAVSVQEYFAGLLAERRARPAEDIISHMLREDPTAMTEEEWVTNAALLFAAGHETTVNLLGNGMLALLRHPEQARDLRRQPRIASALVSEVLRYDSPMQVVSRSALVDVSIAGHRILAGDHVAALLGSANRDPAFVQQPDEFDVHRAGHHPLSFGAGAHACLGARLARAEAATAFAVIAEGLPESRLVDEDLEWAAVSSHRGLNRLPIACG